MLKYTVQFGQSIWDIGAQLYGHVTGAEIIVEDNPKYAITDVPVPGSVLLYREVVPRLSDTNEAIVAEYKSTKWGEKGITVASGQLTNLTTPGEYVTPGYWVTGYTRQYV